MTQANQQSFRGPEQKCSMFGCSESYYNSVTMGPGTYVGLCKIHYMDEIREEKSDELREEKSMISVTSEEYLQILKEWHKWISTYYSFIGPQPDLVELLNKTVDIIARGEMK